MFFTMLLSAVNTVQSPVIEPVLVGDADAILTAAQRGGHSIDAAKIVHAAVGAQARSAVNLATSGEVLALMKGAIHSDALMHAVVGEPHLLAGRRISHVLVLEVAKLGRPLLLTDAAVNIAPDLDAKRDITQNAIDLARALGGLDALVFTAGIGQHAPTIRARICELASCLGISLDARANANNSTRISDALSRVMVFVIPTDEETVVARRTLEVWAGSFRQ